ncbi:MAG: cell division protein FtsQ/DivIB [Acidimicrobiales bacterium]
MSGATMLSERRRTRAAARAGRSRVREANRGGVDPRIAERRRAVDRHHSRRRVVAAIAIGMVVGLGGLAWPLLHSGLLSASVVKVTGNGHTPTAQVLSASGLDQDPPMIDVNAGRVAARLEALPWVERATVSLHWPDGVTVALTERTAVAAAHGPSGWAELDPTGRVLAVSPSQPPGLVTLVSAAQPAGPGRTLSGARACLAVAAALPAAFKSMVTAVSPSPGGGVDLALADGVGVVLGVPTQLPAKFEDIASLLAGANLASGSVIDVTVPPSPEVAPPTPTSGSTSRG